MKRTFTKLILSFLNVVSTLLNALAPAAWQCPDSSRIKDFDLSLQPLVHLIVKHSMPRGTPVTSSSSCDLLETNVNPAIRSNRPGLLSQGVLWLQDNDTHTAKNTKACLEILKSEVLPHPPYLMPDLVLCDFHLFGPLKKTSGWFRLIISSYFFLFVLHTGDRPHCCSECGKQLSSKSNLSRHKTIHTGEKPYYCCECGKQFSRKSYLSRHKKIHTGEKSYCCPECGKQLISKKALSRHKRVHMGEKSYCCLECGKQLTNKKALSRHKRIHTGEKPYCCPECGKHFSQKIYLRRHRTIHTGEKPYCCSVCDKRFSQKGSLHNHRKIHTGEKLFCCSECGKHFLQFSQKTHLQSHQRIHTGEKPYCCSECGKQFINRNFTGNSTRSTTLPARKRHWDHNPYCVVENEEVLVALDTPRPTYRKTDAGKPDFRLDCINFNSNSYRSRT
uniref:Zinc finger protein 660-like n=1 Tax=Erpetoichthys calabaricus TaxID=27687 RepID=A0A8C4RLD8_ERPCA